jgi:3-deoxy-7-phosphoheptulonate synthase
VAALRSADQTAAMMVDCSHGNSGKDPARQPEVARAVLAQRQAGQKALIGIMLESHLEWGNQPLTGGPGALRYGVSITDACMDWVTTASLLQEIHTKLA